MLKFVMDTILLYLPLKMSKNVCLTNQLTTRSEISLHIKARIILYTPKPNTHPFYTTRRWSLYWLFITKNSSRVNDTSAK